MKVKEILLVFFLIFGSIFGTILIYRQSVRSTLNNPFDEMIYSETNSIKVTLFTPLSTVIGSDRYFKSDDDFKTLSYDKKYLKDNEDRWVFMSRSILSFTYKLEIKEQLYFEIAYEYSNNGRVLTQEIYLVDQSDSEVTYIGDELLEQLSTYGKDVEWLQSVSQKVLEEDILGLWFEKGSGRYSLDNLGNLEIEYDDVLAGVNK